MITKERKINEFKFGQLITINNIVYRCQKVDPVDRCECCTCAVASDYEDGIITRGRYLGVCDRCQEFCKNFKRVSNGKPGRQVSNQMC